MGSEFYTDRRTDMPKLVVAFCTSAIAPKKQVVNKSAKFPGCLRSPLLPKN